MGADSKGTSQCAPTVFKIQGHTLEIKKITIQQDIEFMNYIDTFMLGMEPKGKGLAGILADTLEKLPGLMPIIFKGQEAADKVNWMLVDTDTLLDMKAAFEKKNPTTIKWLKDTFSNSGSALAEALTGLTSGIGAILSSSKPQAAPPTPTTSGTTGA